jgi:hypothetical protein
MVFLRTPTFDNCRCRYIIHFYSEMQRLPVTWCWSIREEDLKDFLETYSDVPWVEVKPTRYAYALNYRLVDEIVTNKPELLETLELEPFNEQKHSLVKKPVVFSDAYYAEFIGYNFENPYAVVVLPEEPEIVSVHEVGNNYDNPFDGIYFKFI